MKQAPQRAAPPTRAHGPNHRHRLTTVNRRTFLSAPPKRPLARGFTLLELLVVVAIIGLLAAYVGPRYFSQVGKSEQSVARSQIEAFSRALGVYRLDVGAFPSTQQGLEALRTAPEGANGWKGPYLDRAVPNDPWGRPYQYRSPGSNGDFSIESLGKDGQPGGTGDAADVSNG